MEKKKIFRIAYNLCVSTFLIAGATIVFLRFAHLGDIEYTENARVRQHITPLNTRVQGFIREIRFQEFQPVKQGDTLVIIEDAEYRLRLAQAEAELVRAQQDTKATGSSIQATEAGIHVTDAEIEEARVNMENAQREDARFERLLKQEAVTQQQYDNVHTAYLSAKARYDQVQRSRKTQHIVKSEQEHHLKAANATLRQAEAAVEMARLNLSYCYIVATCNGVLGQKDIQEGQLVQPGQTLINIVDQDELWVIANYKERQMAHIAVGSKVLIKADAVPDEKYEGVVERISDATGSEFSLIPIDNATGNFVKVEQRIPVRISLKGNAPEKLAKLKAGYNVECEVKY